MLNKSINQPQILRMSQPYWLDQREDNKQQGVAPREEESMTLCLKTMRLPLTLKSLSWLSNVMQLIHKWTAPRTRTPLVKFTCSKTTSETSIDKLNKNKPWCPRTTSQSAWDTNHSHLNASSGAQKVLFIIKAHPSRNTLSLSRTTSISTLSTWCSCAMTTSRNKRTSLMSSRSRMLLMDMSALTPTQLEISELMNQVKESSTGTKWSSLKMNAKDIKTHLGLSAHTRLSRSTNNSCQPTTRTLTTTKNSGDSTSKTRTLLEKSTRQDSRTTSLAARSTISRTSTRTHLCHKSSHSPTNSCTEFANNNTKQSCNKKQRNAKTDWTNRSNKPKWWLLRKLSSSLRKKKMKKKARPTIVAMSLCLRTIGAKSTSEELQTRSTELSSVPTKVAVSTSALREVKTCISRLSIMEEARQTESDSQSSWSLLTPKTSWLTKSSTQSIWTCLQVSSQRWLRGQVWSTKWTRSCCLKL